MVITFSNDRAFDQLRTGGVVTFRSDERKRTPRDGVQKTWCNRKRGGEKELDVLVAHVCEKEAGRPDIDYYRAYRPMSGFPTKSDWLKAIMRLHGDVPPTGHFYYVTPASGIQGDNE